MPPNPWDKKLIRAFKRKSKDAYWQKRYTGGFGGETYFISKKKGIFPTGILPLVLDWAKEEEIPVVIPKFGEKVIAEKYDAAVLAYMKEIEPQMKKDIESLYKKTAPAFKKGDSDAFWSAVDEWLEDEKNQDSPLQLIYLEDSFFNFKTGKLKLDDVKESMMISLLGEKVKGKKTRKDSDFKKMFVNAVVGSSTTEKFAKGDTAYKDETLNVEDSDLYVDFAQFFSENYGVDHKVKNLAKNQLPVVISYDEKKDLIVFSYPNSFKVKEMKLKGG